MEEMWHSWYSNRGCTLRNNRKNEEEGRRDFSDTLMYVNLEG